MTILAYTAVCCCGCGSKITAPERTDQPLIYHPSPRMSRGFGSAEQDGQTVTLTADLGQAPPLAAARQIDMQRLSSVCIVTEGRQDIRVGPIDIAEPQTQLYTTFSARTKKPGRISLGVYKNERLLDGFLKAVEPGKEWTRYRFILRVHEPIEDLTLRIQTDAAVEIENFGSLCKKPAAAAQAQTGKDANP